MGLGFALLTRGLGLGSARVRVRVSPRSGESVSCVIPWVIPIYGHMTMYYTHIWSYGRVRVSPRSGEFAAVIVGDHGHLQAVLGTHHSLVGGRVRVRVRREDFIT